jgi:hypothetical protein
VYLLFVTRIIVLLYIDGICLSIVCRLNDSLTRLKYVFYGQYRLGLGCLLTRLSVDSLHLSLILFSVDNIGFVFVCHEYFLPACYVNDTGFR